jgi:hypothetical protein
MTTTTTRETTKKEKQPALQVKVATEVRPRALHRWSWYNSEEPVETTDKPFRELHRTALTLKLGAHEVEDFVVHRELLEHHSRYFRALLSTHEVKRETEHVLEAPKINAKLFEPFRCWLYTREINLKGPEFGWLRSARLCCFAEEIGSTGFTNALLDQVVENVNARTRFHDDELGDLEDAITFLSQRRMESNPLLTLLVDAVYFKGIPSSPDFSNFFGNLPQNFLADLAILQNRMNVTGRAAVFLHRAPFFDGAKAYYVEDIGQKVEEGSWHPGDMQQTGPKTGISQCVPAQ